MRKIADSLKEAGKGLSRWVTRSPSSPSVRGPTRATGVASPPPLAGTANRRIHPGTDHALMSSRKSTYSKRDSPSKQTAWPQCVTAPRLGTGNAMIPRTTPSRVPSVSDPDPGHAAFQDQIQARLHLYPKVKWFINRAWLQRSLISSLRVNQFAFHRMFSTGTGSGSVNDSSDGTSLAGGEGYVGDNTAKYLQESVENMSLDGGEVPGQGIAGLGVTATANQDNSGVAARLEEIGREKRGIEKRIEELEAEKRSNVNDLKSSNTKEMQEFYRKEISDLSHRLSKLGDEKVELTKQQTTLMEFAARAPETNELHPVTVGGDVPWQEDKSLTVWARKLLEVELEEVELGDEDVKALNDRRLPVDHTVRILRTRSIVEKDNPNIFVRDSIVKSFESITKQFDRAPITNRYAALIGNPGIGKSRSMEYFLWRLLRQGELVVFHGKKRACIFYPPIKKGAEYRVSSCTDKTFQSFSCKELEDKSTWFLVDQVEGREIQHVDSKTVLFTSPNEKRYKAWLKEGGQKHYVFVQSHAEILAMRPSVAPNLNPSQALKRCDEVGCLPRYVLLDGLYNERIIEMRRAADKISEDVLVSAAKNNPDSVSDQVSSALFCFAPAEDSKNVYRMDYISNYASRLLLDKSCKLANDNRDTMDSRAYVLETTVPRRCFPLRTLTRLPRSGEGSHTGAYAEIAKLPPASHVDQLPARERPLLMMPRGFPLCDFADARDRVYQVTTGATHSINFIKFKEGMIAHGGISMDDFSVHLRTICTLEDFKYGNKEVSAAARAGITVEDPFSYSLFQEVEADGN